MKKAPICQNGSHSATLSKILPGILRYYVLYRQKHYIVFRRELQPVQTNFRRKLCVCWGSMSVWMRAFFMIYIMKEVFFLSKRRTEEQKARYTEYQREYQKRYRAEHPEIILKHRAKQYLNFLKRNGLLPETAEVQDQLLNDSPSVPEEGDR